jgi:hypothetical protein
MIEENRIDIGSVENKHLDESSSCIDHSYFPKKKSIQLAIFEKLDLGFQSQNDLMAALDKYKS